MTASRLPPRVPEWIFRLDDPVAKQRQQMQVSARRPSPRSRPCLLLERDRPEAALARSPAVPTRRAGTGATNYFVHRHGCCWAGGVSTIGGRGVGLGLAGGGPGAGRTSIGGGSGAAC